MSYFHKVVEFFRAIFTVLPKIFALAPTYRQFAEKNRLSGNTAYQAVYLLIMLAHLIKYLQVTESQKCALGDTDETNAECLVFMCN